MRKTYIIIIFTINFFKEMRIIIVRYLVIKVFNKIITFNVININIYAININNYNNYSKVFSGVLIKVIIFIKLFKYKSSIFNKFKNFKILKS